MEDKILGLKSELKKIVDEIDNNYMVGLEIKNNLDEHFINQSFLNYMYNNNILYCANKSIYFYDPKFLYYYDEKNKILYFDIFPKVIYQNIILILKNIIIDNNINNINNNINNNNILYITFGNNQPDVNNKIIKFIQKYFSIIYITNYTNNDINILSEYNNSFIFYRKIIYKFNDIINKPYINNHKSDSIISFTHYMNNKQINNHKSNSIISFTHYINNKQIKYNKLLYTFILIILYYNNT